MAPGTFSLDELAYPGSDSPDTVLDLLPDPRAVDPLDIAERISTKETVRAAVAALPANQSRVINSRLDGMTLAEIGAEMGVCAERIRIIEKEGYKRLRKSQVLTDYNNAWRKWGRGAFLRTGYSVVEVTAFPELLHG